MTEYVLGEVPEMAMTMAKKVDKGSQVVRVPPFVSKPPVKAKDKAYTLQDALRHAQTIEDVWRRVGHDVRADIIKEVRGNTTSYKVRMPDLVNGLPVKKGTN